DADGDRPEQDQRHQGSARADRPGPERGEGRRRGCPEGCQRGRLEGRGCRREGQARRGWREGRRQVTDLSPYPLPGAGRGRWPTWSANGELGMVHISPVGTLIGAAIGDSYTQ